ncbi:MAG: enoyl-CoA hydratase [Actinobacteria bacterium]|jgi:enoyl-CoA hydratase|nr:enoyl-CoA hydratase [Actinomycetota bacterium]NBR67001.1 enoyl-CoA hydratase [Actinomycetota bacterium]NBU17266.1 enoyl-CoA hydratase [Actinomycetota bacterium]
MAIDLASLQTVSYRVDDPGDHGIAVVSLDRVDKRNAQNNLMTYELNACYDDAARRGDVKVIVLRAEGPHFSAGHDLRDRSTPDEFDRVFPQSGFTGEGQEAMMAHEEEVYFNMCWRWRNIPKPVIAAAQGKSIAGALMLLWVADIIIAAEDATFSDPVVAFGVNGVEYFGHPWEFGARKAKELLFTGDSFTAQEAMQLGMVNRVVPAAELDDAAMAMARRIAAKPGFALKLAKESVNQTLEAQGQYTAMRAAFSLQHLGHSNNKLRFGMAIDPSGL